MVAKGDRTPEKRKAGGSALLLTTISTSNPRHSDQGKHVVPVVAGKSSVSPLVPLRDRRWPMKPSPTNPRAIMAQVDGSGTAATEKAFPSIELSADPAA